MKERTLFLPVLAVIVTAGFFAAVGFLLTNGVPNGAAHDAVMMMLGALSSAWTGVVAYFFASSRKETTTTGEPM